MTFSWHNVRYEILSSDRIRFAVTWAHAHLICWWWRWEWLGVRIPCWYWPGSGTGSWFLDAAVWSCDATCSAVKTPERAAAATALTGRTNARYCSWSGDSTHPENIYIYIYMTVPLFSVNTNGARECVLLILEPSGLHTSTQIWHRGIGMRHSQHYLILGYNAVGLQRLFPLQWDLFLRRSRSHKLPGNRTGHYSTNRHRRGEKWTLSKHWKQAEPSNTGCSYWKL